MKKNTRIQVAAYNNKSFGSSSDHQKTTNTLIKLYTKQENSKYFEGEYHIIFKKVKTIEAIMICTHSLPK